MPRDTLSASPIPAPLATLAASLLLAILAFRTTTSFDPYPAWSSDPLLVAAPVVAITPALGLGLDVASILLAGLVLAALARRDFVPRMLDIALLATGGAGIILHALILSTRTLDDLLLGATWLSALCSGFALAQAARLPHVRALAAGTLAALMVAFALRSCVQVFIDHPQMLTTFRQTRAQFFASQGWSEGSAMALAYERRITQADASAWFGMANVLATTAATTLTFALALISLTWRRLGSDGLGWPGGPRRSSSSLPPPASILSALIPALLILATLSLAALILAGSKGGYAAAALGILLIALHHITQRTPVVRLANLLTRLATLLGPTLIALALAAVALRGLIGERVGELSLLFRWFYLEAATRIALDHPLLGVGPAGFKDAYLLAKTPISPEDISSPHSVLFDYAATLGVPGLALCVLVLVWASRAGRHLIGASVDASSSTEPNDALSASNSHGTSLTASHLRTPLLAILALATASSAFIEQPIATIDGTLLRFTALGLGLWVALTIARVFLAAQRGASVALAAAALVAIVHSQIELTAIHPNAAMWLMVTLAIATPALADASAANPRPLSRAKLAGLAAAVLLAACAIALATALPRVARWQQHLITAEQAIAAVREARQLLDLASTTRDNATPLGELRVILSRELGRPVLATSPPELVAAFTELRTARLHIAMEGLAAATALQPTHFQTRRSASTLALQLAEATATPSITPATSTAWLDRANELAMGALTSPTPAANAWSWIAVVRTTSANALTPTPSAAQFAAIAEAWTSASNLAPFDPEFAYQAALALVNAGRPDDAMIYARRALTNHENYRLDPLQQLSTGELRTLRERFALPPS